MADLSHNAYPRQPPPTESQPPPQASSADPNASHPDARFHQPLPAAMRATKNADTYRHPGRNLIVCLDGTGDKFDSDNSNIVHLVSCLKKDDASQVTYYQSGIGTYDGGGLSNGVAAGFDMAVGSGLGVHVRDAYQFIMQTYRERDKICLFGFSRGAYTARCLAGMLHKVGLLPAHNKAQIPFAYQFYKDESKEGWSMSEDFKQTFCQDVNVHFLGLFDSVNSVGFIPRKLPLSSTPANQPAFFRHAMALDEHRAKFKVCRFQHAVTKGEQEAETTGDDKTASDEKDAAIAAATNGADPSASSDKHNSDNSNNSGGDDSVFDAKSTDILPDGGVMDRKANTDVLEVWFMGAHADVGGGAVKNEERHKLSQIPLRWLLRQCFECDTGILFHTRALAEMGLDVHGLWPVYIPLEKPTVGPPPSLMEKYTKRTLGPRERRATHLHVLPDHRHHQTHEALDPRTHAHAPKDPKAIPDGDWTPELVEDYFDAMAPINDQLVQAKGWWILEFWPIKVRLLHEDLSPHAAAKKSPAKSPNGEPFIRRSTTQIPGSERWIKKVRLNLGRYRPVLEDDPNLHWTVKLRMNEDKYRIRTRAAKTAVWNEVI